mgnify:CR=1 FL=1
MEPAGSTFFWSFAFFVLAAPLYRGGNRALPLLALELAAIGFLRFNAAMAAAGQTQTHPLMKAMARATSSVVAPRMRSSSWAVAGSAGEVVG